jgi:UPF0755 protein
MNTRKAALRAGAICLKVAIFIAIVLGIVYLGQTALRYTHAVFSDAAYEEEPGRTIKVKIPEDVSGKRLAKVLEENGLIENANVFQIQMKMAGFGDTVKAGSYELNTSMKPSAMLQVLAGAAEE